MAFQVSLKNPSRGSNPKDNRAQSHQPLSNRSKRQQNDEQYKQELQMNARSRSKPIPTTQKKKSSNIFRKSKQAKKSMANSHGPMNTNNKNNAFKIQQMPSDNNKKNKGYKYYSRSRNKNLSREKAMTSADLLKTADNNAKENGLALLQQNWNNRKPYANKRNQLRSLSKKLPKTEFKLLLDENQMAQCYDPVKLYELNKELMVKNIGTCRVEGKVIIYHHPRTPYIIDN